MTQIINITREEFRDYATLSRLGCSVLRCLDVSPDELVPDDDVLFRVLPLEPGRALVGYIRPCYVNGKQLFVDMCGYTYILFLRDFCTRAEAEPWYRYYFQGEPLQALEEGESQPPQYLKELMFPFEVYQHSGYAIYPMGGCQIDRQWDVICPGGLFIPTLETCRYILQDEFQITDQLIDWNKFDQIVYRTALPVKEFSQRIKAHLPDFENLRRILEDVLNGEIYTVVISTVTMEDGEEVLDDMLYFGFELFSDKNELEAHLLAAYRALTQEGDKKDICLQNNDF